jgi:tetratricopeptide (TPR) repeat protein
VSSQDGESLNFAIKSPGISCQHTPSAEAEASSADDSSMDWTADAPPYSQPLSQLLEALEAALSSSSPLSIGTSLSGGAQTISLEDIQGLSCENNKFLTYDLGPPLLLTQQETVDAYKEDNECGQLPWRDIKSIFLGWNESPLNEVYVFPKSSVNSPRTVSITSRTLWDSLKHQEIELTNKISILKRSLAPNHPAIIAATEALALINRDQGNYIQAAISLRRVEKLQAETSGPTSLKTLSTSRLIADMFQRQGKYDQAWEVIKRIEPAILSLVDPDHDLAIEVMVTKSLLFDAVGDYQSAENIDRQILQIRLQAFGPRDSRTRQSMNDLGVSLSEMGEYNGAEKLLRMALQIHSMDADIHNWKAYQVMLNIGWAFRRQKFYDESYSVLYDAVQKSKTSLGPEHLRTLDLQNNLAFTLYAQGKLEEGEEIFREVWSLHCKLFGESAFSSLYTVKGLALVLKKMDRIGEAIAWSENLFGRSLDLYGPEHEWALDACEDLGECYEKEGRYADALELYQQMVEKLRSSGNIGHPAVAYFESSIENIYEVMPPERNVSGEGHLTVKFPPPKKRVRGFGY